MFGVVRTARQADNEDNEGPSEEGCCSRSLVGNVDWQRTPKDVLSNALRFCHQLNDLVGLEDEVALPTSLTHTVLLRSKRKNVLITFRDKWLRNSRHKDSRQAVGEDSVLLGLSNQP